MSVRSVRARFGTLGAEITKFGVIGVLSIVLDLGLFNVLHESVGMGPLTSKALSTVVAALFAFAGNRWWSFRHRARSGLLRELPLFLVLNAVGLGIVEACLALTYYVLSLHGPVASNAAVLGGGVLGTLFRFWAYKRWVFLNPDAVGALDDEGRLEDELESVIQL
jgi:putative flippase GtrA